MASGSASTAGADARGERISEIARNIVSTSQRGSSEAAQGADRSPVVIATMKGQASATRVGAA